MLKISVVDSPNQRRLVLEGELITPWVAELKIAWMKACVRRDGRRMVLDFKDVTYISADGEAALWELMNRGARFCSGGVLTKHILHQLKRKRKAMASAAILPFVAEEGQ